MVALPSRRPFVKHPEMVWVERARFMGWACSECGWEFDPSHIPPGNTIAEIKQQYERERDEKFASHVCAAHPKGKN
jgi:rubredoxin